MSLERDQRDDQPCLIYLHAISVVGASLAWPPQQQSEKSHSRRIPIAPGAYLIVGFEHADSADIDAKEDRLCRALLLGHVRLLHASKQVSRCGCGSAVTANRLPAIRTEETL